ncbi:hypothetical protein SAMN04489859_10953 [Paracoccus alcaliphilus]|uniref:Uncharacterized protein n=1 Tax=Paracoccus alcaliphilus TaxID=34002 RepID=A0A1H8PG65_9RHOB|nr:hypothetical protein SAMN04489859_10953 [Paracoccus alcaliphilus]
MTIYTLRNMVERCVPQAIEGDKFTDGVAADDANQGRAALSGYITRTQPRLDAGTT